jgi:hypothetical protein
MVDYVPVEKGTAIRLPSVANLMIDSQDRNYTAYPTAGDFQITKTNSILNGFFTRVSATEIAIDWAVPNIVVNINSAVTFTVVGLGGPYTVNLVTGNYTVAQVLDILAVKMTSAVSGLAGPPTFSVSNANQGQYGIQISGGNTFWFADSTLAYQLGFMTGSGNAGAYENVGYKQTTIYNGPDLRSYTYIDFISYQLTYAQDVKDGSTNPNTKNVLLRFYFDWDNPPQNDKYGFAILPGYQKTVLRRIFSPAKQIRWTPNLPIGNLAFEVWGRLPGPYIPSSYSILNTVGAPVYADKFDWSMTLQVSEV